MSEVYNYVRYEDDYIKIEQIGKSGWIADFRLSTKASNVKAVITQVSWTANESDYIDGVIFNDVVTADGTRQGGFTIGRSDNPLNEHTVYTVLTSYELYIDGKYVDLYGISFTFKTTSRYEAGAIYTAPVIVSVNSNNFYSEIGIDITINTFGTYCDHIIRVTAIDRNGTEITFDNSNLFVMSEFGDLITYTAIIKKGDVAFGKVDVFISTVATEKNPGEESADVKTKEVVVYREFRFNDIVYKFEISAEEWNDYNEALADAIRDSGHGTYRYDSVMKGEEITLELLNQPIVGYYNAFGWYFGITPRTQIHYKAVDGAVSANIFFGQLENLLNSFYV